MLKDKNGKALAKRVVTFRNSWTQGWGLMCRKPAPDTAYVFDFGRPMRSSFHMLFVFWPIDLYLLDKQGKVMDKKLGFTPFTTYKPKKPYWYAIETRKELFAKKSFQAAIW